jgi:hypothetical protein
MTIEERVAALQGKTTAQLKAEWRALFGEEPRSGNIAWMRRRLAWALQAAVLGGLSDAAKKRIEELTQLALASMPWGFRSFSGQDVAVSPVKHARSTLKPGTVLTRPYKGKTVVVAVREDGFEYDGHLYRSLTAVATAVTGSHWNGLHFFRLGRNGKRDAASA